MLWEVHLIVSSVILVMAMAAAMVIAKSGYKSGRLLTPSRVIFAGVILSAVILFVPIHVEEFKENGCGLIETVLVSVHNMIRLFVVDGEFSFVAQNVVGVNETVYGGYTTLFSILFILAPILTFGFVLSFFKNTSAYAKYFTCYKRKTYIFSELNEKSFSLAKSLYEDNGKNKLLVFTDVFDEEEEKRSELVEKAKGLGAICFKKDIVTIDFSFHSKKSEISFFVIGENQSQNISEALKLIDKYEYRDNTNLYVFSTQVESEIMLSNAFGKNDEGQNKKSLIKVRRINEVRSLVFRTLYEAGYEKIFATAYDEDGVKKINAVVIGMGQHGTEMTKALSWFCQMDGYLAEINAFDIDGNAESKFVSMCPELMEFSGKTDIPGEVKYTINIHSGLDVDSTEFDERVRQLSRPTFVFVALGDDEKNISVAIKLRSIFERMKFAPVIQAVVYNSEKKEALLNIKNFKGNPYNIEFIGDIKTSYSKEVILDSDVEKKALERHLKWGDESAFWRYDYNYKSSVASAIHRVMKSKCNIPGVDKNKTDRTSEELWGLRILEHCRWNAYMRSEGYVYGGTTDKNGRNDIAKTHNCLVPFDELPLHEQEKDDD